jgi:hypothetical protein
MKLTIESTSKVVELLLAGAAIPARVWEGRTESGIPVHCYVTRLMPVVADSPQNAELFREFERELLLEQRVPLSDDVKAIPLRLIL